MKTGRAQITESISEQLPQPLDYVLPDTKNKQNLDLFKPVLVCFSVTQQLNELIADTNRSSCSKAGYGK